MPLDVVGEGLLSGLFRAIVWIVSELFIDIMIKGLGYIVCRPFNGKVNPDSVVCVITGLVTWLLLAAVVYQIL